MGCTSAIVFTCFGAAYGTAKAGVGVSATGVLRPDLIVKSKRVGTVEWALHVRLDIILMFSNRYYSCCHGWYHRYLRPRRLCLDLQRFVPEIIAFHWLYSIRCWPFRRFGRYGCWVCHWYCGWCGCQRNSTTAKIIRRHDPDSYFRWSFG